MAKQKPIPKDQFENIKLWLNFYEEHKKLPYNEIICCKCKSFPAKLKGAGIKHALKNAGGNIEVMLKSTMCKECRNLSNPVKERKPIVKKHKTLLEMEEEIEKIRRDMPKINLNSPRNIINLVKDRDMCEQLTKDTCIRPDIYLDNDKSCDNCSINENCKCPLKRFALTKKKLK